MISNRNDIFRCLIIGSCLFIFWGVIIIWIVSYQNLCHALYLTLYFSKYSGVTIIWNSTRSMPWDVPINWNMSSNWHQRVWHKTFLGLNCIFYQAKKSIPGFFEWQVMLTEEKKIRHSFLSFVCVVFFLISYPNECERILHIFQKVSFIIITWLSSWAQE